MFDLDIVLKIAVNALKSAYLHHLRFSPHFKIDCEDFFSGRAPDRDDICSIGSL